MKARAACAAVLIVIAARAGGHPLAPRPEHEVTAQELVYRVPGMDRVSAAEPARIRTDLPVYFVRAGRDNPRLNAGIDRLWARAIDAAAPWTLVSAPALHHAFDVLDDEPESRRIVRETLEFFRDALAPPPPAGPPSPSREALSHWFAHEYSEAAAAYGAYVESHPDDATARLRLGLSQAHTNRPAEAEANLQKAVALGADGPVDLYNVACGYALLRETERALDWLQRAVAAGFSNRALMESDDDLEALRESPRFRDLLARIP
jgi:Tetratricopeptide repeat